MRSGRFIVQTRVPPVTTFLVRVLLIAAGLVIASSLAVVLALMFCVWCVRAAAAKLTGRPVTPFIFGMDPRSAFEAMARRAGSPTPRADAARPRRGPGDVTDVEPRPPR
jgi:hypothetical protein